MITANQVALQLGISPRAVYDLAKTGRLPSFRMGVGAGALRFAPADVGAYKARQPAPVCLTARELRVMERLRLAAAPAGGFDLPPLTPAQHFHAFARHRNTRHALWADRAAVADIYAEAKRLTASTGVPHQVDHIIPLKGERVSGLHVESNLRVLPRRDNIIKGNKVIEC